MFIISEFTDGPGPTTFSIKPNTINVNENVTFSCNVTVDGNPTTSIFEWLYSNGSVIARTTANYYYFTVTSISQEGSYNCTAINVLTISSEHEERSSKSLNSEYLTVNGKQLTYISLGLEVTKFNMPDYIFLSNASLISKQFFATTVP